MESYVSFCRFDISLCMLLMLGTFAVSVALGIIFSEVVR